MKCLLCGKELGSDGDLREILFSEDVLCRACRKEFEHRHERSLLEGIPCESDWIYDAAFSAALIQFKECGDEALSPLFLGPFVKRLRRQYRGYTLCLMPSSLEKREQRGFSHLQEMYEVLHLPMLEPFEKGNSQNQKKLGKIGREEMKHGILLKKEIVLPKKLLLVDDVITTGSTLRGALSVLNRNEHQIQIYACARVDHP